MKVGLVGAGFMGSTHARAWSATDAQLVGILARASDPTELAERYGARAYDDLDKLIADIDVLDICAPSDVHVPLILQAAASGRHVICEKPLALSIDAGAEAIAACERAGVHLLVAHVVRFAPEYRAARERVRTGDLGEPAVLRLARLTYQPRKPSGNWFLDPARSGGIALDLMIHDFDYARWVAGDVETVNAKAVARGNGGPANHMLAILRHRNGAISHIEASWAYPAPVFRTSCEIACPGGLIQFDSETTETVRTYMHMQVRPGDVPGPSQTAEDSPWTAEIRHFLAVLKGEAEPVVTPMDALEAVRVAQAATESTRTGLPVRLVAGGER